MANLFRFASGLILLHLSFSSFGYTIPDSLQQSLDMKQGEEKLSAWKEWLLDIKLYNYEAKLAALPQACQDAAQILPATEEQSVLWCFRAKLDITARLTYAGLKQEAFELLKELKTQADSFSLDPKLKDQALMEWYYSYALSNYLNRDFDTAQENYEKAATLSNVLQDTFQFFRIRRNQVGLFYAADQFQASLKYADQVDALLPFIKIPNRLSLALPYYKALSYTELGDYQKADALYRPMMDSMSVFKKPVSTRIAIGNAHNKYMLGQKQAAFAYFEALGKKLEEEDQMTHSAYYRFYARCLALEGDLDKVDDLMDEYLDILVKETHQLRSEQILEWQAKFESSEKQAKIEKLEQEQRIAKAHAQAQLLTVILIALFLLGLFFFYLLRAKNVRKQMMLDVERDKKIIENRDRLFYSITHDIRTPLALMLAPLERAHRNSQHEMVKTDINLAQRNGKRLLELFNQILDWNKAEAKALKLNPQICDLGQITSNMLIRYEQQAIEGGIPFKTDIDLPEGVFYLDYDKTDKIISNLITNAIKFSEAGQWIKLSMTLQDTGAVPLLDIEVQDNGPGISKVEKGLIFERYTQGTEGKRKGGTGIGLALVKELVHLVGGEIKLDTILGKGSTFSVKIPIRKAEQMDTEMTEEISFAPDKAKEEKALVLIVEDEPELLNFLDSALKEKYEVLTAHSAQIGLSIALNRVPDIIISDWILPDEHGGWFCRAVRRHPIIAHLPIMILTSRADAQNRKEALEAGAIAWMNKPFQLDILEEQLRSILAQQNQAQQKWSQKVSHFASTDMAPTQASSASEFNPFLTQFLTFLKENMANETINIETIAKQLHLSRVQLFRKVKTLTGKSPSQILRELRLEKARVMLRVSDLSVAEIAYKVGFSDANYFSTAYKKHFRVSPTIDREHSSSKNK